MSKSEKMIFTDESGEETVFYVHESTTLQGVEYLLVTETEDLDGEAYILREAEESDDDIMFDMVDDDDELMVLADIFEELLAEDEEDEYEEYTKGED